MGSCIGSKIDLVIRGEPSDLMRVGLPRYPLPGVVAWLRERYDGYAIPDAVLYKPLSASQRTAIDKVLSDAGRTKAKDTFSAIKRRWQAMRGRAEGVRSATVEVVFAEECVVVGDKRYTIEAGRYPAIRVGKNRMRSDILEQLLIGST